MRLLNCKYRLKGSDEEFKDLEDFLNECFQDLKDKEPVWGEAIDVFYSLFQMRDKLTEELKKIKDSSKESSNIILGKEILEEDGLFGIENNSYSVSLFIDSSPEAILNGNPLYTRMERDKYRIHRREQLKKLGRSNSDSDSDIIIDKEFESWDTLNTIGAYLHKLSISRFIGISKNQEEEASNKIEFVKEAKEIVKNDSKLFSDDILERLFDMFSDFYKKTKGNYIESKAVRGINVTHILQGSGTKLFGHIDYAIVDRQGNLNIYNFKTSYQYSSTWSDEKTLKYKLELAFLKQMLKASGINIQNIRTYLVPINVSLNEDKSIKNVFIEKHENNSIKYIDFFQGNFGSINTQYDYIAKYFIKSSIDVVRSPSLNECSQVIDFFNAMFTSILISDVGIEKSALDWIKRAPSYGAQEPLVITKLDEGYNVIINGTSYHIKDDSEKSSNKEIINKVKEHIIELNSDSSNYVNEICNAIYRSYTRGFKEFDFRRIKGINVYLDLKLKKYITDFTIDTNNDTETINYNWEFLDTLADSGILMFRHKDTGLLDLVVISSKNLDYVPKYRFGFNNILGDLVPDNEFILRGSWGNIETVRGLLMLNTVMDSLPEKTKLGKIDVISRQKMYYTRYMEPFVKDYLNKIIEIVGEKTGVKLKSKFKSSDYVDIYESIVSELKSVLNNEFLENFPEDKLLKAMSDEDRATYLFDMLNFFLNNDDYYKSIADDPLSALKGSSKNMSRLAELYIKISEAYLYYSHELPEYNERLSKLYRYVSTSTSVPNNNIQIAVKNLLVAVDTISNITNKEFEDNILNLVLDFYRDTGYSNIRNMTIGDLAKVFDNLYLTDKFNKKLLLFKNPYTDNTLSDVERTFLKKVLFLFNKYRFRDNDNKHFTSYNDPEIPKYIESHQDYLNVPLERKSKASRSLEDHIHNAKRILNILSRANSDEIYSEFIEGLTKDELEFYDEAFRDFYMKDPFLKTEDDRLKYIDRHGIEYFETNVENLLIDRLYKSILTELFNRYLIATKALLLQLKILGSDSGVEKNINEEIDYIQNYIKRNVFKKSLIEPGIGKGIVAVGLKLKSTVTFMAIAGNIISAARDIENGFMENYLRTVTHHLTDITASNLTKAYAYVIKNARTDAMKINLLSKLCVVYRLSNVDIDRIPDKLKTGRQGLKNWDDLAYSTLRGPDFINRMVLFVARAMQDGVLDAWSLDGNRLKYDWRKDLRFSVYANKSRKGDPEYKKLEALYLLHLKMWNQDHINNKELLVDPYTGDLPEPYSNQEIRSFRALASNIYGSYDKILKAEGEFVAIGLFFAMYTTWMNEMWNNWARKPGYYNDMRLKVVLLKDEEGNLLFLTEDHLILTQVIDSNGNKKYLDHNGNEVQVSENELIELLDTVPMIVQGVIYSLGAAWNILNNKDLNSAINYIKQDENVLRSLNHAMWSIILSILFRIMFKFIIDPKYEETKKGYKDMSVAAILLTDLAYKPLHPAVESFDGPLNIVKYLGQGTNPPVYNVPQKALVDGMKTAFGNKTALLFITGNFAFARIGKNVAKILAIKNKEE